MTAFDDLGLSGRRAMVDAIERKVSGPMVDAIERKVDLSDLVVLICSRLGVHANYVARLDLDAGSGTATIFLYRGEEGRCAGPKYLVDEHGEPCKGRYREPGNEHHCQPAMEVVHMGVTL